MPLVLASSSPIRRVMLDSAGVAHEAVSARVDEADYKARYSSPHAIVMELAKAKALEVSSARPGDWVIGSDSIVSIAGRTFDKPADREQAAEHLRLFSGQRMELTSAVALARYEAADWGHCDRAVLHVRELSDHFIQAYLDTEWPEVAYCVGVFRMEGLGVQLFERIEGDYFTILGMPLLPLLEALRHRGILEA